MAEIVELSMRELAELAHQDAAVEQTIPAAPEAQSLPQQVLNGRVVAYGFDDAFFPKEVFYFEIKTAQGKTQKFVSHDNQAVPMFERHGLDVGDTVQVFVDANNQFVGIEPARSQEQDNEEELEENSIRPVNVEQSKQAEQDSIRQASLPAKASSIPAVKAVESAAVPSVMPATLFHGRFVRGEDHIYRRQGETRDAIADEGQRIRFIDKQMDAFQAGVELAKAKGWEAIEVTGTEKFRAEAWFHAKAAGLEVLGYEPMPKDLQRLEAFKENKGMDVAALDPDVAQDIVMSKHEAEQYAFNQGMGVQGVSLQQGRYAGRVLFETAHHLLQDIGRGTTVVHEKAKLDSAFRQVIDGQESLRVQYRQGRGLVEHGVPERSQVLGR